MGVRLTCGLARELESERGCKEIWDWGHREHTLQEWCEISSSGVLGLRGHGAEVARLGSATGLLRSRHSVGKEQKKTELGGERVLLEETETHSLLCSLRSRPERPGSVGRGVF